MTIQQSYGDGATVRDVHDLVADTTVDDDEEIEESALDRMDRESEPTSDEMPSFSAGEGCDDDDERSEDEGSDDLFDPEALFIAGKRSPAG